MDNNKNPYVPPRHRRSTQVPYIPPPERKEQPVIEKLVAPASVQHLRQPSMKKVEPHPTFNPQYNDLYSAFFSRDGWRYIISGFADGSFTPTAGAQISVPITLAAMPQLAIDQWPGAVHAYWVVQFFACAPRVTTLQPVEVAVPATAGSVTLFTGPGVLTTVTVTATGTTDLEFQDGAGNIIAEVPSTATLDQVFTFNAPFGTSLVANKATTTPAVTANFQPDSIVPGALEVAFSDFSSVAPLGVYLSNSGGNNGNNVVMHNPITDPDSLTVGNLLVTLQPATASVVTYTFQMGLGVVYVKPTTEPYKHEPGDMHEHLNSHHH